MSRMILKWLARTVAFSVAVLVAYLGLFYRGGHHAQIQSGLLGEERGFQVYLPASYDERAGSHYPVIYSLDGEKTRHGQLMAANARMLSALVGTPEVILVAIYTHGHRTRDFAPNRGAEAFTAFLESELMPHIDGRFRTSGQNVISGHSCGGLYALYAFAEHPGLFDAHFAYVPSVFHYEPILDHVGQRLKMETGSNTHLYLVSGAESQEKFWRGFDGVIARLTNNPNPGVSWKRAHAPLPHPLSMIPGQIMALRYLAAESSD